MENYTLGLMNGLLVGGGAGLLLCSLVYFRYRRLKRTLGLGISYCPKHGGRIGAREFADGCAQEQRNAFGYALDRDEVRRLREGLERLLGGGEPCVSPSRKPLTMHDP